VFSFEPLAITRRSVLGHIFSGCYGKRFSRLQPFDKPSVRPLGLVGLLVWAFILKFLSLIMHNVLSSLNLPEKQSVTLVRVHNVSISLRLIFAQFTQTSLFVAKHYVEITRRDVKTCF